MEFFIDVTILKKIYILHIQFYRIYTNRLTVIIIQVEQYAAAF